MADFTPLADSPKKPSLEEYTRVNPSPVNEDNSPTRLFCPHVRIRVGSVARDSREEISGIHIFVACNRWGCEICARRKRAILISKILFGRPNRFLTLTVKPKEFESPRDAFLRTSRLIPKLFFEMRKWNSREIRFCRILESTAAGFPHYHFALNSGFLAQSKISEAWNRIAGSPICDIRQIENSTASYISKYLSKSNSVPYSRQRVTFSRNWPREEKRSAELPQAAEWTWIYQEDFETYARHVEDSLWDLSPNISLQEAAGEFESENFRSLQSQFLPESASDKDAAVPPSNLPPD